MGTRKPSKPGLSKNRPKNEATPLGTSRGKKPAAAKPRAAKPTPEEKPAPVEAPAETPNPAPVVQTNLVPAEVRTFVAAMSTPVSLSTTTSSKENPIMSVQLTRSKISKSGKKAQYNSAVLVRPVTFPRSLFGGGEFPETITLDAPNIVTAGEEAQRRAEEKNRKRAEKGLKPLPTPAERQAQLEARAAKLQAKLDRANAAKAKLAAKSGGAAPAPAETASAQ